jgi:hypothetical protein
MGKFDRLAQIVYLRRRQIIGSSRMCFLRRDQAVRETLNNSPFGNLT